MPVSMAGRGRRSRSSSASASRPSTRSTPSLTASQACAKGAAMFERFAAQTRQAVHLALSEARVLGARPIGTDHLLLGLAHGRSGPAVDALKAVGLDAKALRRLAAGHGQAEPPHAGPPGPLRHDLDPGRPAAEAARAPRAPARPAP